MSIGTTNLPTPDIETQLSDPNVHCTSRLRLDQAVVVVRCGYNLQPGLPVESQLSEYNLSMFASSLHLLDSKLS